MRIDQIIDRINELCMKSDFVTARIYIEHNINKLEVGPNYVRLNQEAKQLYHITKDNKNNKLNLSRLEIHTINQLNKATNNFDLSTIRLIMQNSQELIDKREVQLLLTTTSKSVLETLGYSIKKHHPSIYEEEGVLLELAKEHDDTGKQPTKQEDKETATKTQLGTAFHIKNSKH